MLDNVDALVFDIQDVGARFYTYSCTMLYSMEEAAEETLPFFVLDRPNPITGVHVEGPMLDPDLQSFTGCFEIPVRHGMTLGELAAMANGERKLGARSARDSHAGLGSGRLVRLHRPALGGSLAQYAQPERRALYPGVAMLEASPNYSVGRGTDSPFELIGADWIHGRELAGFPKRPLYSRSSGLSGALPAHLVQFRGKDHRRGAFRDYQSRHIRQHPVRPGTGYALNKLYPGKIDWQANRFLIGNQEVLQELKDGVDPRTIVQEMEDSLASFIRQRERYLLYR